MEKFEFNSGKLVESELLGQAPTEAINTAENDQIEKEKKSGKDIAGHYLGFRQAQEVARRLQPYSPENPGLFFPAGILKKIGERLGVTEEDMKSGSIKFFTALGTILDQKHGTDAFVDINLDPKRPISVPLDVTSNPSKDRAKDKNIVLINVPIDGFDLDVPEDRQRLNEVIELASTEILSHYNDLLARAKAQELVRHPAVASTATRSRRTIKPEVLEQIAKARKEKYDPSKN